MKILKGIPPVTKKPTQKKTKARLKAYYKIKIPKGQLCERCNKDLAVERHHEDYNKPLEVVFMCKLCHAQLHNEYSQAKIKGKL